MDQQQDVAVLSKALSQRLISFEQYSLMLRELSDDPQLTAQSLLLSRANVSQEQLSLLVEQSAGMRMDVTQAATEPDDDAGETLETIATRPTLRRSTTMRSAGATTPSRVSVEGMATPDAEWSRLMQVDSELRYQLKAEIARGGLGRILQARDQHLGRDVAIKEMLPDRAQTVRGMQRFLLEAQVTGQLEHPSIVPIYALGINPAGQPFYSMKLIGGRTLSEMIKEYHALEPKSVESKQLLHELLSAMVDMCNAIAFAHDRGVLHRDIKPQNVMIGDFGETLVVDWGLAKVRRDSEAKQRHDEASEHFRSTTEVWPKLPDQDDETASETATGTVLGTIVYMSPEQASGAVETLDARSDIFSLGATLYELLTGKLPYSGQRLELLEQARLCKFPPPRQVKPDIPAALEAICLKAMAAEPDHRYQSAKQLGEEIDRWQSGRPVEAYPEPWLDRAERFVREHRTMCLSTAAALLALVFAGGLWQLQSWRRIDSAAAEARTMLSDGQAAFNDSEYDTAAGKFSEAMVRASTEESLLDLRNEIHRWIDDTQQRIDEAIAKQRAVSTLSRFDQLHDDALFFGTLLGGYDIQDSIREARQAATDALALYGVRGDTGDPLQLEDLPHSDAQKQGIRDSCRRLRMVLADAAAQPLPGATQDERRAAARRALAILKHVDETGRELKSLHLRRALYLAQAGDTDAARIERSLAEGIDPADAHDHFLIGDFHYRNQDYTLAIGQFQQALREMPGHFWAQYYLGVCHVQLKHWSEAIASLNASISPRDDFVYIYLLRGLAYGELGDLEAAEADFARAAELKPDEYGLYINRGIVRLRHRRLKEAESDFRAAVGREKEFPAAYLNLAETLRLQGKLPEALVELERCLEFSPKSARAYHAIATVHMQQDKLDEAMDDLNEAVTWVRGGSMLAAQVHADRGRVLHRQREYEEALVEYEAASAERRDYHFALVLQGLDLMDMAAMHAARSEPQEAREDRRQAIVRFNQFLAESPLVAQAHQSDAADDMDQPALDRGASGEVIPAEMSPTRLLAIVYRERGIARNLVGDVSGAMQDFAHAMELAPGANNPQSSFEQARYRNLRTRRGWAYLLRGRQLALVDFNAAIKQDPDDAEPYTGRGYVLVLQGDYHSATSDADRAVALNSENPGVYFNAAGVYAQAIGLVLADKTADDRDPLAETYRQRAIKSLRRCLELSPEKRQFYLLQMAQDTALDAIRSDEAFIGLVDEFSR